MCIARRLAEDGAKVVVSSRNQEHVDSAVKILRNEPGNLNVEGIVCNVGSYEQRRNLVEKVIVAQDMQQKSLCIALYLIS